MKPINEWYAIGFDGGDLALIGFSTVFAKYFDGTFWNLCTIPVVK